uniref:Uncharacterized protein n=1 Tax=Arundo donax TaxID=35708 RepID=A0A0A9ACX6_ARUDO
MQANCRPKEMNSKFFLTNELEMERPLSSYRKMQPYTMSLLVINIQRNPQPIQGHKISQARFYR